MGKVVICAAMWMNPHIVILDEPTNYLDRDGLGALTRGLEEYQGGVVIISHNEEFCNGVCQQKWIKVIEKKLKDHKKAEKDGKKAQMLTDEEMWQLGDKLEELKQMLAVAEK